MATTTLNVVIPGQNAPAAPAPTTPTYDIPDASGKLEDLAVQKRRFGVMDQTSASNVVVSDAPVVNEEKNAMTTVNEKSKVTRDLSYLDREIEAIERQLQGQIKSINSGFDTLKTSQGDQQGREVGQTSAGLAAAGGYLGFSGSGTGVMLSLTKSHRAEMQALEAKRQQAIADAREAAQSRRFDVVKLKAQEIKDIEQEQYNRDQDYFKVAREENAKEMEKQEVLANQDVIFKSIQAGNKTPESIFKALGNKVPIETINKFLEQITPVKKADDRFSYSKTDVTSLLGAGLDQEDIAALNETVNAMGYTDEVRAALPPAVRVAADKIYRTKTGTGGSTGSGVVVNGKNIKSVTLQVLDGFTTLDQLTPTVAQQVRDDLYTMGFAEDEAPDWFTEDMMADVGGMPQTYPRPGDNLLAYPALDGVTEKDRFSAEPPKPDRNKLWQQFTKQVLEGSETEADDGEDEEITAVRSQIEARSR